MQSSRQAYVSAGREICDLMLAVTGSTINPTISRQSPGAATLSMLQRSQWERRSLQKDGCKAREYRKYSDDGIAEIRTAYEVSIGRLERVE